MSVRQTSGWQTRMRSDRGRTSTDMARFRRLAPVLSAMSASMLGDGFPVASRVFRACYSPAGCPVCSGERSWLSREPPKESRDDHGSYQE